MKSFIKSLMIGVLFGLLDSIPMMLKKLNIMFIISAFLIWVVVGILYPKLDFKINYILRGIIITFAVIIPTLPLIYILDKPSMPIIIITSLIFSILIPIVNKKCGLIFDN